jgi:general secretion pathway protein B
VSFILDALRKSDHERQRSALPGLAQVPMATPAARLPRWVAIVIAMLATAVVTLGIAWFRSVRAPSPATVAPAPVATVERRVELPPPPVVAIAPSAPQSSTLQAAATLTLEPASRQRDANFAALAGQPPEPAPSVADGDPELPSAAALAAEGVALPPLRLELHAFSDSPADRFVFINGRKYGEGARLPEGPELVSIEPRGAVLRHAGRRFLLVQE